MAAATAAAMIGEAAMAENGPAPATGADPTTTPAAPAATGEDALGDAGKRALQAERERARRAEAEAKAARDELAKLKADSDSSKSDMERVLAKLAEMEKKAQAAERKAVLAEVASKTGLSMAKVSRLQGDTVDELLADAGEVFDWKPDDGKADKPAGDEGTPAEGRELPPSGRPTETLRPGAVPGSAGDKTPEKIAESILSSGF